MKKFNYNKLSQDELMEKLEQEGVMTTKDIAQDLKASITTGKRYFNKIAKEYPTAIIKLTNQKVNGKIYGKKKSIRVIPYSVYLYWYEEEYLTPKEKKELNELLVQVDDESKAYQIFEIKKKLNKKTKKELVDILAKIEYATQFTE